MTAEPTDRRPPLRERKKRRTRAALVGAALELFTRDGVDAVTLDRLCDEVEVSKRTFFRTFTSKEDVAMAPLQDYWGTVLEVLEEEPVGGRPVVAMFGDTLLSALDRMPGQTWAEQAVLCARLAARTPSMNGHNLQFCETTMAQALAILHRRLDLGPAGDPRPRLAGDMVLSAFHHALDGWAEQDGAGGTEALARRIRATLDVLPDSLALVVGPRTGPVPTGGAR